RLKPNVTVEQAGREMEGIAAEVLREARSNSRLQYPVLPLRETIVGDVRALLWVLSGAVFLVMLIAIANVANLMLARAAAGGRAGDRDPPEYRRGARTARAATDDGEPGARVGGWGGRRRTGLVGRARIARAQTWRPAANRGDTDR